MLLLVRMLLINTELLLISGKIKWGLSPGLNKNYKHLQELHTVLDLPE
jgi:hypothetical protein